MENFKYSIPTEIYFGKGQIKELANIIEKYGENVLLVYGGGSIKKIGLYEKIDSILKENNIKYIELSGVDPNPRITTVRKGVNLCKENNIDVVLAVGGGSTLDCSKAIAAASCYNGEPWDIVTDPSKIKRALPIVTVLTLSATGSEMDGFAVISNLETNEKLGTGSDYMKPKASILDPEYTYSVSKYQTAAGTADIISHIFEVYFDSSKTAFLQNRMAESLLKTCIKYGEIAVNDPNNYEARSNLMWASSLAINGLLSYGKNNEWSVHPMEHELSAFYDITHGVGLAILTPHWMRYCLDDDTLEKFVEYGVNVWNIDSSIDKYEIANMAIEKTSKYFEKLGIPKTLKEVGIEENKLAEMAKRTTRFGEIKGFKTLTEEDVLKIFKLSM